MKLKIFILVFVLLTVVTTVLAESFSANTTFKKVDFKLLTLKSPAFSSIGKPVITFHNDTIHRLDFRYNDRKRGIKPYIAPVLLITTGTILHFSTDAKENFQDWVQQNFGSTGHAEDYLLYVPGAAVYGLNAFGVKGKNNFGNRTAILVKSFLLNEFIVSGLKVWVNEERPNGGEHSFPSGHTSKAFVFAHFMHKEFGEKSIWFSVGAYSCATTVAVLRVVHNAHWISDVVAGAGFGILSTEFIYLTHQYKWDNEHLKRLDIFPWSTREQKGLALVYTF
jgi:membrane-associated phospholipid phosphatase